MKNKDMTETVVSAVASAPKLSDMVREMAGRARLMGKLLSVIDIRYTTAGIPEYITDDYIYYSDGYEIGTTGKLGGKPTEAEQLAKGGKLIRMDAVVSVDLIEHP